MSYGYDEKSTGGISVPGPMVSHWGAERTEEEPVGIQTGWASGGIWGWYR